MYLARILFTVSAERRHIGISILTEEQKSKITFCIDTTLLPFITKFELIGLSKYSLTSS